MRSMGILGREATNPELADARKLLTEHHIEYPRATDLSLHEHHARMIFNNLADNYCVLAQTMLPHLLENRASHLRNN